MDGNVLQLSGIPLHELPPAQNLDKTSAVIAPDTFATKKPNSLVCESRQPNAITFVRNRILYARAALNAKGGVRFGMRHIRESPSSGH